MTQWNNEDGLLIRFEAEQSAPDTPNVPVVNTLGNFRQMVVDLNYDNLPAETSDLDNDGTNDGWNDADPYIPAYSLITRAFVIVESAFTTGTSAALNIGLSEKDGSVVDADGIDAAIAVSALAVDDAVVCDGALVGGAVLTGSANSYIKAAPSTGSFTAGKAKLVIEYVTTSV